MAFDFPVSNPFRRKPPSQKSIAKMTGTAATQKPAKAPPAAKPPKTSVKQRAEKWFNGIVKSAKSPAKSKAAQTVAHSVTQPAPLDSTQYLQALQALAQDQGSDQAAFAAAQPANMQAYADMLNASAPADHSHIFNNAQQIAPGDPTIAIAESYATALAHPDQSVSIDPAPSLEQQFLAHKAPVGPSTAPDAHLSGKVAEVKEAMRQLKADMEKRGRTRQEFVLDDGNKLYASFLLKDGHKTGVFVVEDEVGKDTAGKFGQWASLSGDSLWLNRGAMAGVTTVLIDGKEVSKAPDSLADHVNPALALDEALENATRLLHRISATAQPISNAVKA